MNAQLVAALRTGAQLLVSWLVTHVAVFAMLPESARNAFVEGIVTTVVLVVWTYGVRWLETRTGPAPLAVMARLAGRILMLGLAKQPTYADPDPMRSAVAVGYGGPPDERRMHAAVTDYVLAVPE